MWKFANMKISRSPLARSCWTKNGNVMVGIVFSVFLFVSSSETACAQAESNIVPASFKIMTYNVQRCWDNPDSPKRKVVPARAAQRIVSQKPDFCCVNEVRDNSKEPSATQLAALAGMHKTFYGDMMILSKEIPIGSEGFTLPVSGRGWGPRYCLICEFTNLCVAVTHLDIPKDQTSVTDCALVAASNAVAIAAIRDAFGKYAKPVFFCGDWNTQPHQVNMANLNEFIEILSPTNGVRTWQGRSATGGVILDYIAVDKAHAGLFSASSYVVEDIVTSDHNLVVAEVYRRPEALQK